MQMLAVVYLLHIILVWDAFFENICNLWKNWRNIWKTSAKLETIVLLFSKPSKKITNLFLGVNLFSNVCVLFRIFHIYFTHNKQPIFCVSFFVYFSWCIPHFVHLISRCNSKMVSSQKLLIWAICTRFDRKCYSYHFHIKKNANHALFMQFHEYRKLHKRSMINYFSYMEIVGLAVLHKPKILVFYILFSQSLLIVFVSKQHKG